MEHSYILFFVNQSTGAVDCEREERCAGNCLLIRVVPRVQPRPYFGIEVFCFVLYGRETERRTTILRDDMKNRGGENVGHYHGQTRFKRTNSKGDCTGRTVGAKDIHRSTQ